MKPNFLLRVQSAFLENSAPAEKGEMLLAIEKRCLNSLKESHLEKIIQRKKIVRMTNPHVKAFVDAAEKAKGFGGAN